MSRLRAAGAVVAAVALLLAGCTGSNPLGPSAAGCRPQCHGVLAGAKYLIRVPSHWNGTLLIYSHGYRSPFPSGGRTPSTNPEVSSVDYSGTGTDALSNRLLGAGYALAGSSYRVNGWAVDAGIAAAQDIYTHFVDKVGTPQRTLLWGDSLGGLITEALAERHPSWVDGALPICSLMAGATTNLDLFLDAAFAVKAVLDPSLRLTGYPSAAAATAAYRGATAALTRAAADPSGGGWAKLVFLGALLGVPQRTQTYDGHTALSRIDAIAESVAYFLSFATVADYAIEQQVGGYPFGNVSADYAARLTPVARTTIQRLGGDVLAYLAALEAQPRVTPDAAARARFVALGDTTGDLQVPTLTLHDEADPLALVQNESALRQRAAAHGDSRLLLQLFVAPPARYRTAPYGAGHCTFSVQQRVGAVEALDRWVRSGSRPAPADLVAGLGAGLDVTYSPAPWPAGTG
jgi:hypothetical protein